MATNVFVHQGKVARALANDHDKICVRCCGTYRLDLMLKVDAGLCAGWPGGIIGGCWGDWFDWLVDSDSSPVMDPENWRDRKVRTASEASADLATDQSGNFNTGWYGSEKYRVLFDRFLAERPVDRTTVEENRAVAVFLGLLPGADGVCRKPTLQELNL